jgi:ribonuclease R
LSDYREEKSDKALTNALWLYLYEMRHKKNKTLDSGKLSTAILQIFREKPGRALNYKQISSTLGFSKEVERQRVQAILSAMQAKGQLESAEKGKYMIVHAQHSVTGIAEITASGSAWVISENQTDDIFIPRRFVRGAWPGDLVRVMLWDSGKYGKPEGEIVEILKRGRTEFVGRIEVKKNFAVLIPDRAKSIGDIFIAPAKLNGARDGDKVVVKISDRDPDGAHASGEVTKILGKSGENNAEIHAILEEFQLPYEFPAEVMKEATGIPLLIPEAEIRNRRDFRNVTTFTIDPADAKDFDDALSVQPHPKGGWEIGVHIADVTWYVKPGSAIEEEAITRATSVYLVDRVIPMLPEVLSNQVCSLRPGEDKLCYSAVFHMNDQSEILSEWIGRTIIHSDKRFTYEEAQQVIESGDGPFKEEVLLLHKLARNLREQRFKVGSIGFERDEVKFRLDEKGAPLGVFFKVMKDSNWLIEEFMLLANKRVALAVNPQSDEEDKSGSKVKEKLKNKKEENIFVYRIHGFHDFVRRFGYKLNTGSHRGLAQSMNKLLKDIDGKKEQGIISQLAIRTMARAEYSTKNIGHYGLAFDHYTHFTSPIRRYPDMMVHRLLNAHLNHKKADAGYLLESQDQTQEYCKHSSERERIASEAERASIKYKQVEYLSAQIGKMFDGLITGVTEWGMYVEISENLCEGMIKAKDMNDDIYVFDQENYCYIGRRRRTVYQLGDKVRIRVKRADVLKKQVDFSLIEKIS